MKGFIGNIEKQTVENRDFRRVLYTGPHIQLVLMSLEPGEEIGEEVHGDTDQFFRVEQGEGEVWIDGQNVSRLDQESLYRIRRIVGYVFQFAALFDSMTLADNVAMALKRLEDYTPARIRERVLECLHLVDLDGLEDRYPSELSGGQRKRAGLARAIATEPTYLLYDEPTTGLDPANSRRIGELIRSLKARLAVTSVIVTHELELCFAISDRVALLQDGRIAAVGPAEAMRRSGDPAVRAFLEGAQDTREGAQDAREGGGSARSLAGGERHGP